MNLIDFQSAPTIYREDYVLALRKLTRQGDPAAYIRMMGRAHEFSATIVGDDMDAMEKHLEASNAFKEPDKAKLKIVPVILMKEIELDYLFR